MITGSTGYATEIKWVYFLGNTDNRRYKQRDGPYMLSLDTQFPQAVKFTDVSKRERENYILFDLENEFGTLQIRIFKSENKKMQYEVRNIVDKMPARFNDHDANVELFVSYNSGLKNDREFLTDSNGLKLIHRKYGDEGKYNEIPFNLEKNMYPVNRIISTKDKVTE